MSQLDQIKHRLSKARELLLREEIEGEDYRTIKTEASERMTDIEAKLKTSNFFSDSMELLWDLPISKVSFRYFISKRNCHTDKENCKCNVP